MRYIAIDLGATSGRVILASVGAETVEMTEVGRFPNEIFETDGISYWNLPALWMSILDALKKVGDMGVSVASIGIDTWGVDYACVGADGKIIGTPVSYRDRNTSGEPQRYFQRALSANRVYDITGIQVMDFNTLFQLSTHRRMDLAALKQAKQLLFLPDALSFMMTGEAVTEYTIASTSQLLDVRTRDFSDEILQSVDLTRDRFPKMVYPGHRVGVLTKELSQFTGLGQVPVIAVAGHDTASAVAAVPATSNRPFAYLSSGTWSLMGVELKEPIVNEKARRYNFTNEGGIDSTIRFLKNICGMWILEQCRKEWTAQGIPCTHPQLMAEAEKEPHWRSLIFPDAPEFANPRSMIRAIVDYCAHTNQCVPHTPGQITRCIYDSLALRYLQVMEMLRDLVPESPECLHVIGGGSQNTALNQLTASVLEMPVIAGPVECTAIGNIMLQARAAGEVHSLRQMRALIARAFPTQTFQPQAIPGLQKAYKNFLTLK
ncbi:MAG: rhamnulokinase [Bacteroidales bacterium]|nr:rhamnulokinase [Bacteroidales bacterium]